MNAVKDIEELQKKLEGIFDLTQVEDCRKVIGTLLRTIQDRNAAAQKAHDDLKTLALMVMNENPDARRKALDVMAGSKESKQRVEEHIVRMCNSMTEAKEMSNRQLLSEVTDKIWGCLDQSGRESAILGELLFRTKKLIAMPDLADCGDQRRTRKPASPSPRVGEVASNDGKPKKRRAKRK